jgi:hypothetical protein
MDNEIDFSATYIATCRLAFRSPIPVTVPDLEAPPADTTSQKRPNTLPRFPEMAS